MNDKKAQIWVETVLYTLIGLAVIGLLLAVARPKIAETQDDFIIKQTLNAMNDLDNKILEVKQAIGNRRVIEFQLSRGTVTIDTSRNYISWKIVGSSFMFSEPGSQAYIGKIIVETKKNADKYDIQLSLNYSGKLSLRTNNEIKTSVLQPTKTPYQIVIENVGGTDEINSKPIIDISSS